MIDEFFICNISLKKKYIIPAVNTYQAAPLQISLIVYNVLGNEIATLVNEEKPAGNYKVEFEGDGLASGVYIYQLRVGEPSMGLPAGRQGSGQGFVETKKMILLR